MPQDALRRDVTSFLREAERRIDRFCDLWRIPGFVPSDYVQVYHALKFIASRRIATGNLFCEWGSGFGVVACLAAMTGFKAWGIEIEGPLVDAARQLAADFGLNVEFLCDSYFPANSYEQIENGEQSLWMLTQPGEVWEQWGLEPNDFDLIFAYPGPDDDQSIRDLFNHHAGTGAALLTYHGREGIRLRRKVHPRKRRHRNSNRSLGLEY